MASFLGLRYINFSLILVFFFFVALPVESVDAKPPLSFSFERFEKNRSFASEIALYGDVKISHSKVRSSTGWIMYKKPIRFFGTNPGFSTCFCFSISKGNGGKLAFLMNPSNGTDERGVTPSVVAVEFGNHIEINVGGVISVKSSNLSAVNLVLNSGRKLQSWIDYDGVSKIVEVRLSKSKSLRPSNSLISYPIDLSNVLWKEAMYVSLSSSTGNSTQTSSVYSWSFGVKHGVPYLMHSEPLDPQSFSVRSNEEPPIRVRRSSPGRIIVALLFGAACGAFVASMVFTLRSKVVKRHPVAPVEYPVLHLDIGCEKILLDGNKTVDNAVKS